ncbi:hypothetical protein HPB48_021193 [Haemaphysalis longicornis]|uniref:Uncharacterized protein n=1 Tax=Haemaphysalis longicornis TaxID=44386 RepID=A0A9J6FKC3_HAELO|nr:hypothetical protein HPB48_021193 [Haemaphysalis longicornis]
MARLYRMLEVSTLAVLNLAPRLSELGFHVGQRVLDLLAVREKNYKRETKLLNILLFVKSSVWKPAKVTAHWYKGTTFMIKFEESVIARDKALESR